MQYGYTFRPWRSSTFSVPTSWIHPLPHLPSPPPPLPSPTPALHLTLPPHASTPPSPQPDVYILMHPQSILRLCRDVTIVGRHASSSTSGCSRTAEPIARSRWSDSSLSDSSTSSSGSYSQSEEDDAELEQYQEALYNLEQQRDAVRL